MSERSEAAQDLFDEVRKINNRLRWLGDTLHLDLGVTAAKRSLLLTLDREGPQTVPDLARERLVSRQVVQTQVNDLLEEGLVESQPNPRHRRSTLLALTSKGDRLIQKMLAKESELVKTSTYSPSTKELTVLREQLQKLRAGLEAIESEQAP
ncbi:MarR family winged helix-turn-helix transcriptional regulator [Puniceicoccus vermicola]|uniref:MarR family transcriptional regulator n=1 Tax=Puniceicoccus vermicola TaxID=388746 RepID=A0A7X1AWY1_9BACT|nr:MarR family transcriptional regulator [Puniceicoccus vermicola]MBC2601525.1 MarR family transcriptional regulator [Puniceicoccus vermicola]